MRRPASNNARCSRCSRRPRRGTTPRRHVLDGGGAGDGRVLVRGAGRPEVVFLDRDGQTKYRLGPSRSPATRSTGPPPSSTRAAGARSGRGGRSSSTSPTGRDTFADVTTRLEGRQLAIVVDDQVISAPTVQNAITGGVGVITGSFTEAREGPRDPAERRALPVALTTQQVQTVSPTLGRRVAPAGARRGVAGLILLWLYLLLLPGARDRGLGRDGDLGLPRDRARRARRSDRSATT